MLLQSTTFQDGRSNIAAVKKQMFQSENFRVQKLSAINQRDKFLCYLMHDFSCIYIHETGNERTYPSNKKQLQ